MQTQLRTYSQSIFFHLITEIRRKFSHKKFMNKKKKIEQEEISLCLLSNVNRTSASNSPPTPRPTDKKNEQIFIFIFGCLCDKQIFCMRVTHFCVRSKRKILFFFDCR